MPRRSVRAAGPAGLEAQLLPGRAGGLQAVLVAQQMQAGAARRFRLQLARGAREPHRAGRGSHQSRDDPEQAGLARAVGSGQGHGLAGGELEGQVFEQHPPSAGHRQVLGGQG